MSRRQPASLLAAVVALALAGSQATVFAQSGPEIISAEPTMLNRSPFIPPGWSPPEANRPTAPQAQQQAPTTAYEFRGVYKLGGEYRFLVSPPKSRNGNWVQLGKEYEDYEVRAFDPKTETLTLFYNAKEEAIKLAALEANPTPVPVSGQIRPARPEAEAERGARRTIRPASRGNSGDRDTSAAPPPPAWLQKLREEAAQRRAQATGGGGSGGINATGSGDGSAGGNDPGPAPDFNPGPPPDYIPEPPPKELLDMEIPPPPSTLPPEPPAEVLNQMQQSLSSSVRTPGT